MKLDLTVFNQDISGMKVFELADWLEYFQNQVMTTLLTTYSL